MKKRRIVFGGNKATLMSIILILGMSFFAKLYMPAKNIDKPGYTITYLGHEYTYAETVKSSPYKFVKPKNGSEEGFTVLLMRKDKRDQIPEEIYVYVGSRHYLKYILTIDTK
ncbi:hypothetical protein [Lutispora thermophila]|uniref:Uncharacterized protein n=1 Tax=Lutispora thermophila DSM 19022 TaxID=1122184 RepID=A0A1M6IB19_9FIRM|nr:hypothetical protein [Lutispora thermophila]SHJ31558.1 hypothetical protein SAMN02745176_03160 [Lutispora thermophila DSM 19022]